MLDKEQLRIDGQIEDGVCRVVFGGVMTHTTLYHAHRGIYLPSQTEPTSWDSLIAANKVLEVDLGSVSEIDSAALGFLLLLHRRTKEQNAELKFVAAPPRIKRMLEITGLMRLTGSKIV